MIKKLCGALALVSSAIALWIPAACAAELACETPAWRMVYRHDADGKSVAGAKADLLQAIRRGDPVRVAWGGAFERPNGETLSVEHTADPVFLTISGGSEVSIQLPEHIAQAAYADAKAARFDKPAVMWRGLMTTEGVFDAVWVDRATGEEVRRLPQRVGLAWLVFAPDRACDPRPPLDLAVPGGVRLAEPASE